jgi:hypothetical protein
MKVLSPSPDALRASTSPQRGEVGPSLLHECSEHCDACIERATHSVDLSPVGRGRPRSGRVRGLGSQSACSVRSIISRTPSRLSYTSTFEARTTRKPSASSTRVRSSSRFSAAAVACVTPSTSTTNFPSNVTKSTMYRSIGCWRRNFQRASLRFRSACQSRSSALVDEARSFRARRLNCSIPLTRPLRGRPLPTGERCSRVRGTT